MLIWQRMCDQEALHWSKCHCGLDPFKRILGMYSMYHKDGHVYLNLSLGYFPYKGTNHYRWLELQLKKLILHLSLQTVTDLLSRYRIFWYVSEEAVAAATLVWNFLGVVCHLQSHLTEGLNQVSHWVATPVQTSPIRTHNLLIVNPITQ